MATIEGTRLQAETGEMYAYGIAYEVQTNRQGVTLVHVDGVLRHGEDRWALVTTLQVEQTEQAPHVVSQCVQDKIDRLPWADGAELMRM